MRNVISICRGVRWGRGGGGRAAESRARGAGVRECGGGGRTWPGGMLRGDERADQYLASPRQRRARPSASRTTTPRAPQPAAYLIHAVSGMRAFSC